MCGSCAVGQWWYLWCAYSKNSFIIFELQSCIHDHGCMNLPPASSAVYNQPAHPYLSSPISQVHIRIYPLALKCCRPLVSVLQASFQVVCRLPAWTYLLSLPPTQVLLMTHDVTRMTEMEDYFTKKCYPILPMYMIGRSYMMELQDGAHS